MVSIRVRSRERTISLRCSTKSTANCFNPRPLSRADDFEVSELPGKEGVSIRVRSRERTINPIADHLFFGEVSIRVRSRERTIVSCTCDAGDRWFQSASALASGRL